jgi:hypothetical protein
VGSSFFIPCLDPEHAREQVHRATKRLKYTIKTHAHKSQNRSKSNNRKPITTTRKNLKFKRVIKKHTTKYKTYKRKAKGRKLRGNNHKNNKTMRRYRRVRK